MARNLFTQNPVDVANEEVMSRVSGAVPPSIPGQTEAEQTGAPVPSTPREFFDGLAGQTKLPPNLIWSLAESTAKDGTFDPEAVKGQTAKLQQLMAEGRDTTQALAMLTGDPEAADALMNRAYDIADSEYPTAEKQAEDAARNDNYFATDAVNIGVGGAIEGTGMALKLGSQIAGGSEAVYSDPKNAIEKLTNLVDAPARGISWLFEQAGGALMADGKNVRENVSDTTKDAMAGSEIKGNVFKPSTWTMGENPSLRGLSALTVGVLGNLAPVLIAGGVAGPAGAMMAGAGQGGEGAAQNARETLEGMAESGELQANSSYYQDLIAAGVPEDQAVKRTIKAAEKVSSLLAAPIAGLGGAFTSGIVQKGVGALAGRGIATRVAGTAGISAVEEGSQEVAESVAGVTGINLATGMGLDPYENTFGDFVMGAMAGGPLGALGGIRGEGEDDAPDVQPALEPAPAPDQGTLDPVAPPAPLPAVDEAAPVVPPAGPLEAAQASAPPPVAEPVEAIQRFPDMKPGLAVTLRDGDGRDIPVTFLREDDGMIVVRDRGQELSLSDEEFDTARIAALEEKPKAAEKVAPEAKPEPIKLPENIEETRRLIDTAIMANVPDAELVALEQHLSMLLADAREAAPEPESPKVAEIANTWADPLTKNNGDPFISEDAARLAVKRRGLTPDDFTYDPEGAGVVATPKTQGETNANPPSPDDVPVPDPSPDGKRADAGRYGAPDVLSGPDAGGVGNDPTGTDRPAPAVSVDTAETDQGLAIADARLPEPDAGQPPADAAPASTARIGITDAPVQGDRPSVPVTKDEKSALVAEFKAALKSRDDVLDAEGDIADTTEKVKALKERLVSMVGPEAAELIHDRADKRASKKAKDTPSTVAPKSAADADPTSWFIRDKATGEAVLETSDRAKIDALNAAKYEAVPIKDHLASINGQPKLAPVEPTVDTPAAPAADLSIKDIRAKAAVLTGRPQTDKPKVGNVNFTWDAKAGGWIFSRARKAEVEEALGMNAKAEEVLQNAPQNMPENMPDANPTDAQKEAGNYQMGHVRWNGLDISIETAKGSERTGTDSDGETWSVTMPADYGYIKGTTGADGDHIDIYMGPNPDSDTVVIVNQVDAETGKFDEHKIVAGTGSTAAALRIYEAGFSDGKGKDRIGSFTATSQAGLKAWLDSADHSKPTEPVTRREAAAPADQISSKSVEAEPATENSAQDTSTDPVDQDNALPAAAGADDVAPSAPSAPSEDVNAETGQNSKLDDRPKETKPKPGQIEDFGEKIIGAAKDIRGAFGASLDVVPDGDLATETLSKSFPQPDYQKLLDEGADPWTVAFIHAARDHIPAKPKHPSKVRRWADQVKMLRDMARDMMDGTINPIEMQDKLGSAPRLFAELEGPLELYQAVGHAKSLKGISLRASSYSVFQGKAHNPPLVRWEVTRPTKSSVFSNMPRVLAHGKTKEAAVSAFVDVFDPASTSSRNTAPRKFSLYSYRNREGYYVGVKIGRNTIDLAHFEDVKSARAFIAENPDELEATLTRLRSTPGERRSTNAPRVGEDHRGGLPVTPEDFGDTFGFRGVQFGNWVENDKRQGDLNEAYDALMDLAGVIGVEPKALSLNGELGLAFGARGKGGQNAAAAHYEPAQVVINLTKKAGAGSLAHEWFHALDNYFERGRGRASGYMTNDNKPTESPTPVREDVIDAFRRVRRAIQATDIPKRSKELDLTRTNPYWSQMIEMGARSFEGFVIAKLRDQNGANDYLANIVDEAYWTAESAIIGRDGDTYPYPKDSEIAGVKEAFQSLFDTIQTKETDSGVRMYRRPELDDRVADPSVKSLNLEQELAGEVAKAGLSKRVSVRFVKALMDPEGRALDGQQAGNIISVSYDAADPVATINHEIVHVLRDQAVWDKPYGLFTREEWQALVAAARADKKLMAKIEAAYPDLTASQQMEEAVAELYGQWKSGKRNAATSGALKRIADVLRAIGRVFRSKGWKDAEAVMQAIERGDIGGREAINQEDGAAASDVGPDQISVALATASKARRQAIGGDADTILPTGKADWVTKIGDYVSNAMTDRMGTPGRFNALSLVPGRPLFSELGKDIKAAQRYLVLKEKMDSLRNDKQESTADVADSWMALNRTGKAENAKLMDLMHRATLAGIDPTIDYGGHPDDAQARADHDRMQAEFKALPKEHREMFTKVATAYDTLATEFEEAVIENIKKSAQLAINRAEREHTKEVARISDEGLTGEARDDARADADRKLANVKARGGWSLKSRLNGLRAEFESNRLLGPYFPLARFGNYFVTLRNEDGKVISFSRFEKEADQKAFLNTTEAKAGKAEHGVLTDQGALQKQVDPNFLADVQNLLGEHKASPDLMDSIWQKWLETLPDQSIRTSRIHRKGTKGYQQDALRAFSHHQFHGAHQLARLKYSVEMTDELEKAAEEAKEAKDPNRATMLVNEMMLRHAYTMQPMTGALATKLTSLAFVWYLAATPAAAIVNVSQTTVLGPGIMGARFPKQGVKGAISELAKATKEFGQAKFNYATSTSLTDKEKAAVDAAERRGVIDKTRAHDLANVAENGIEYRPATQQVMQKISWMFHKAEVVNRSVTFLAGYRMAVADGKPHEEAIEAGADMTWKVHFDYQNSSRPRFMTGDVARVVTTFRQYSVNLIFRMARDIHQSFVGDTPEIKTEARKQFVSVSLSMLAHAGIKGVWGYAIIKTALAFIIPGADDDDLERWMQDALLMENPEGSIGPAAWNYAMGAALNGIPGQLAGIDLTRRLGSPSLWFQENDRNLEGEELLNSRLIEALGPVAGIFIGAARGTQYATEGDYWRGAETSVPKAIRDLMKAARYTYEGVQSRKGDQIIEDADLGVILKQAMGFTPAEVSERYGMNSRLYNRQTTIQDRRNSIQGDIAQHILDGKPIPPRLFKKMQAYNSEWPQYPITGATIKLSVNGRVRSHQRNEFGANLNPKLNDRLRAEEAPLIYQ